jgi:hypothetical protein
MRPASPTDFTTHFTTHFTTEFTTVQAAKELVERVQRLTQEAGVSAADGLIAGYQVPLTKPLCY